MVVCIIKNGVGGRYHLCDFVWSRAYGKSSISKTASIAISLKGDYN